MQMLYINKWKKKEPNQGRRERGSEEEKKEKGGEKRRKDGEGKKGKGRMKSGGERERIYTWRERKEKITVH